MHCYKSTQNIHPYLATSTTLVWDLPKDVFKVLASYIHRYPPPKMCVVWLLSSSILHVSDTHHTQLALRDLWLLRPLSCIWLPPPKTCDVWLLTSIIPLLSVSFTGGSLHSQVEHHVWDKFATPILYGIDNFKHYDIFPRIHNHW
jgi:hypothetical protein